MAVSSNTFLCVVVTVAVLGSVCCAASAEVVVADSAKPPFFVKWMEGHTNMTSKVKTQWDVLNANVTFPTSGPTRCTEKNGTWLGDIVACPYHTTHVSDGILDRPVLYQVPLGTPPAAGWPAVIMFQGSFFSASFYTWSASEFFPFGAYYQTLTVKNLLDQGFAVITPDAAFDGLSFYDTNLPPWDTMINLGLWPTAPDATMMQNLFAAAEKGTFGPIDLDHVHGTGISSGAYMTSRMAFSYEGKFRSLAIESGSFAYCGGPLCAPPLPGGFPRNHPPTLFLHGLLDPIVPIWTMELYYADCKLHGVPTKKITQALALHQWIKAAPDAVPAWFIEHNDWEPSS